MANYPTQTQVPVTTSVVAAHGPRTSPHWLEICVKNSSQDTLYIGGETGLTTANGYPLPASQQLSRLKVPPFVEIAVVGASGAGYVTKLEGEVSSL